MILAVILAASRIAVISVGTDPAPAGQLQRNGEFAEALDRLHVAEGLFGPDETDGSRLGRTGLEFRRIKESP